MSPESFILSAALLAGCPISQLFSVDFTEPASEQMAGGGADAWSRAEACRVSAANFNERNDYRHGDPANFYFHIESSAAFVGSELVCPWSFTGRVDRNIEVNGWFADRESAVRVETGLSRPETLAYDLSQVIWRYRNAADTREAQAAIQNDSDCIFTFSFQMAPSGG